MDLHTVLLDRNPGINFRGAEALVFGAAKSYSLSCVSLENTIPADQTATLWEIVEEQDLCDTVLINRLS